MVAHFGQSVPTFWVFGADIWVVGHFGWSVLTFWVVGPDILSFRCRHFGWSDILGGQCRCFEWSVPIFWIVGANILVIVSLWSINVLAYVYWVFICIMHVHWSIGVPTLRAVRCWHLCCTYKLLLFFNVLRVSALFGCCDSQQPLPLRTFVHIGIFPSHALLLPCACFFPSVPLTKSGTCSHHPACSIIPPLMMSRLFPLLLGYSSSVFLPTTLYHGVLCRLLDQFNGSLPQSIAVCCVHNCGDNPHQGIFSGSSLSEI